MNIAIITGASSGLGGQFARLVDGQYDEIWAIARRAKRLEQLRAQLKTPVRVLAMDLTDKAAPRELKRQLSECGADVRLLINAAGYGKIGNWDDISLSDCENMIDLNCRAAVAVTRVALEHMEYMARMKRVFDEVFDKTEFRVNAYPSTPTQMGLVFCDELGMLYIDDRTGGRGKMPELIRYDQIASYEEYLDETPAKEPGQKPTLNGGGLKLKLVQPRSITEAQTQRGMHPHPYIKQELVICFSKRDRREIGYAHIARQHLDHIFGVHDNETSMFGFRMSKAEERELKGQMGMIGAMGAVASAAMKGGQLSEQEKARFVENINLANDAQTGGMALYSRRADEAFAKVQ